jgi:nicotinamidase-related amidase
METTLLVVGMQNDKINAMGWRGEEASLHSQTTVPNPPHVSAFRDEVNHCIEFANAAGWKTTYVLDLHHPMHTSFVGYGGTLKPHCVLSTWGCNPVSGMHFGLPGSDLVVRGVDTDGDSADAFWTTAHPHPHASPTRFVLVHHLTHHHADTWCTRLLESLGGVQKKSRKKVKPLLVICGTSPDGCIENTAASAERLGFRVCIVETATWTLGVVDTVRRIEDLS